MLEWFGRADIIAPFSACEIFPQTFLEGCLAGKPMILDSFGKIQSVHRRYLSDMIEGFGENSMLFHEGWKGDYGSGEGDHYLHAGSAEELAELVLELYGDEKRRAELGNNALDWTDRFWEPKNRGKRIIEVFKNETS